ncbi:hypothetical protein HanRHA438_Chr09g0395791 [Helianthus annuus]|nr:hypothetical protein HanRHA438_Chr09g0395791 [Helianthus annuus]
MYWGALIEHSANMAPCTPPPAALCAKILEQREEHSGVKKWRIQNCDRLQTVKFKKKKN